MMTKYHQPITSDLPSQAGRLASQQEGSEDSSDWAHAEGAEKSLISGLFFSCFFLIVVVFDRYVHG